MNCKECKELFVEYIEGLLEESRKQQVVEHLKDCPNCRAEVQQLTNLHDRLINNGKINTQSNLEDKVMDKIIREQNVRLKAATKAGAALKLRSIIMKSPLTKIAAAAVIIIAAVILFDPIGGNVTWAQVVEPILNAKTVVLDLIIGSDESGPTVHDIVSGSRIRRTYSNMPGMTQIIDLEGSKMLVLVDADNTAAYIDIQGPIKDQTQNYVKFLRKVIRLVQDGRIEEIGEQVIDGQKAIGFVGRGRNEEVTIWADPKTAHPIRIELKLGQMSAIMKNFQFDVPIDETLMTMDVPAGYTLDENEYEMTDATEQDFVESLRVWAEVIGDGVFPDAIGTENAMKQMPMFAQKMEALDLPEEQATQMSMTFGKGMMFHQMLDIGGEDWLYTGAGVKLGDADKIIFQYQKKGSQTKRVIWGDLRVEDMTDNLGRRAD